MNISETIVNRGDLPSINYAETNQLSSVNENYFYGGQ